MGNILPDGSIVPSYMMPYETPEAEGDDNFDNLKLQIGEVKQVLLPDLKASPPRKRTTYLVELQMDGVTNLVWAIASNAFGGLADRLRYTFRSDNGQGQREDGYGNGSKVAVMFVNGWKSNALIVGGVDDEAQPNDPSQQDHRLDFEFNGVNAQINKDGELEVTMKGPTKFDGTPAEGVEKDNTGITVKFAKTGNFIVRMNKQSIEIDHKTKRIVVEGDEEVTVRATKVHVDGAEVVLGDGGERLLKAQTFREAQKAFHQAVSVASKATRTTLAGTVTTLASTPLAPTAAIATSMISFLDTLDGALAAFENISDTYLSKNVQNS